MFNLIRKVLFRINPERAHNLTMSILALLTHIPFSFYFIKLITGKTSSTSQSKKIAGIWFPNLVGLAAGFDKDAKYLKVWKKLGFGFVEIGTITPKPQSGNPKPRLFRLIKDEAIINRMGFNNSGLDAIRERLKNRPKDLIVGGNIGKNKITENSFAANDYELCFDRLYDYVDYFVINVSSPNTPGLRNLQSTNELEQIISPILKIRETLIKQGKLSVPVFVKFAPDLTDNQLTEIVNFINKTKIDGIVLTNTTISRESLKTSNKEVDKYGDGGLSGKPLFERSTEILSKAKAILNPEKVVIGVGGIFSGSDAKTKMDAGADLVQIYTGFVYKGPKLITEIIDATSSK